MEDGSQNLPLPKAKSPARVVPLLEEAEIAELAKRFAAAIPENELSVRSATCILMILQLNFNAGRQPSGLSSQEQDTTARVCR